MRDKTIKIKKDKFFIKDGNIDKSYFYRLPNLTGERIPPNYPGKSKQAIVIFPLFLERADSTSPRKYYIKTACWARRTWLMYTDALDLDIPIKFYVEDILYDDALPIFAENGVDELDVIKHNASGLNPLPGRRTFGTKCLACCRDERFGDYDWTLISDADLFLCKGSAPGHDAFPFFQTLFSHNKEFGCGSVEDISLHEKLYTWLKSYEYHDIKEARIEQGLKDIKSVISPKFAKKLTTDMDVQLAHGALYILPTYRFFKHHRDELDLLYEMVRLVQEDEAAVGLWSAFCKKRLWSTEDDFGIPYMRFRQAHAYRKYNIYFAHPDNQGDEYYWRRSIGCYEGQVL